MSHFVVNGIIFAAECLKVDLNLTNNIFVNNTAIDGTVFKAVDSKYNTNSLKLTNNSFTNNHCQEYGGVLHFSLADYIVDATNNTYNSNSAGKSGGVGFVGSSKLLFTEQNGTYKSKLLPNTYLLRLKDNSAMNNGGAWYLNIDAGKDTIAGFFMMSTTITNSFASEGKNSLVFCIK